MADDNFSIIGYLILKVIGSNILFFFVSSIPLIFIALPLGKDGITEEEKQKALYRLKVFTIISYIIFPVYALFLASLVTTAHANNPTVNYPLLIAAGAVFAIPYYAFFKVNRKDAEGKKEFNRLIYAGLVIWLFYFIGIFLSNNTSPTHYTIQPLTNKYTWI